MTLDEAIKHCLEVAERNTQGLYDAIALGGQSPTQEEIANCEQCAAEHRQLAEWLTDYKELKSTDVQPVDRWISVDEKLPKTDESVLVCVAINKNLKGFGECKPEMRIGWLDDGDKWALQFSNMDYSEVLCWMPLPEPPKDGDTDA